MKREEKRYERKHRAQSQLTSERFKKSFTKRHWTDRLEL